MICRETENELAAMKADLASAVTLADLDALYQEWIGYSIIRDDPSATADSVRRVLSEYIAEFE